MWRRSSALALLLIVAGGCSAQPLPVSQGAGSSPSTQESVADPPRTTDDAASVGPEQGVVTPDVVIDAASTGTEIDPRVFGTNVPAWLGPETLASTWFRDAIVESGVTVIRMPGGSWSNAYDWIGCELGDERECEWTWAARPSDFADLLVDTGVGGSWTVSINETAESAAALVAFFNGAVGDQTPIGSDRTGRDWGTVDDWASLRADHGHDEPIGVELWEVGNEVYGGRPDSGGDECAEFGWEYVWTCDGTDYVLGNDLHDGYLEIRTAMREVDPTISVGAVGVPEPGSWSQWGDEVIATAGSALDFYVVHQYGFDSAASADDIARRAADLWPALVADVRSQLPADVDLAVTEYNLVSFESADTNQSMTRAVNALFIADTIGQLVESGVEIANQWNMANGTAASGTDYGLISATDGSRFPEFDAVAAWGRAGSELLEAESIAIPESVSVYPTRHQDGTLSVIVLNSGSDPHDVVFGFDALASGSEASVSSSIAVSPDAFDMERVGPTALGRVDRSVRVTIAGWSINVIEVTAGE